MNVVAITGPSGAGKTTVSAELAKQLKGYVNIEADHIKHFLVAGFSYKLIADGTKEWQFNEWELLGDSIGLLAKLFYDSGYNVIINGHINVPAWKHIQQKIQFTHKFLLLPHLETSKARDRQRLETYVMGEKSVAWAHNHFSTDGFYKDFTVIDSTAQDSDKTTSIIKELIS